MRRTITAAGVRTKIGLFRPVAFYFLTSIAFAHLLPVSLALFARLAPTFWLLHAGCALGSGLCFVVFKFIAGHHLASVETVSSRY